ncbi:MAG TPA: hypothetical protein VE777_18155 [Gaiellales bacterium]|jgi:hypothetical protein|nr:hypothetical protein [Gaiellales bacterium]
MIGIRNTDDVIAWRLRKLRAAGVDADTAWAVASNCAVDLHAVLDLIERGCDPALAVRIAVPTLEDRRAC